MSIPTTRLSSPLRESKTPDLNIKNKKEMLIYELHKLDA